MASNKETRFLKLKKNRIVLSLLILILTSALAHVLLGLFSYSLLYHMVDQKLQTLHDRVVYMGKLYDKAQTGDSRIKAFLDENETYIIVNEQGVVQNRNGENTCALTEQPVHMTQDGDEIVIYPDTQVQFLIGEVDVDNEEEQEIRFLLSPVRKWMEAQGYDPGHILSYDHKNVELPLWIAVPVSGSKQLIGKTEFQINTKDLTLYSLFILSVGFLIFVVMVIMIVNIIKGVKRQRKMTEVFYMDEVTDRHNWMWFHMKGNQILCHKRNAAKQFAILDVVFMNYRNFCVCHSVAEGEAMLCKVHDKIESILQRNEISAHYASANFVVLLQYKSKEALQGRIEKLIEALEGIDETHKFSFHVGVDLIKPYVNANGRIARRVKADVEKEYNNACAARASMSEQEDSGIAFFNESLVEEQRWMDIVRERQAGALEKEEFQVYYQPKYDPRSGKLRGAEALIRWNSTEFGLVPPNKFIPIFEKSGFITQIDHYMIKHVAKDQKTWLDAGLTVVPVSVNVSRAHFIESDLAEQIRDIIDAEGCPHDLIELELTESAFFDDKKAMIDTILRLKQYGFSVSMDDFGSGYSSLNSLKDMPLDVLKLDAEFFRGEDGGGRGQIVVSEAIRLAKNLNMKTVAEGVEIKEQVDLLAQLGCDMIQGYYFAKPMPKEDYVKRMQNNEKSG